MLLVTILTIPLIISFLMYVPLFSYSKGNVEGWLGFWGSYLGGTIGTLGVIATTYFLIKHETENTYKSMLLEDERKRNLIILEMQIKKNEEITDSILELHSKWIEIYNSIMDFCGSKEFFLENQETDTSKLKECLNEYYNHRRIFNDKLNRLVLHFKTSHNDEKLKNFIKRSAVSIEKFNQLSIDIDECDNLRKCIKIFKDIELLHEELEAYDEIMTFYSDQYKSTIKNINQKEYEEFEIK